VDFRPIISIDNPDPVWEDIREDIGPVLWDKFRILRSCKECNEMEYVPYDAVIPLYHICKDCLINAKTQGWVKDGF
jgi:hypothetical protein